MKRHTITYRKSCGFVLAATLWLLAIMTVAAGFFAQWTQRTLELARSLQDNVQGEIDMQSTQSTLIYLFATQYYTFAGLTIPSIVTGNESSNAVQNLPSLIDPEMGGMSSLPIGGELGLDDRAYRGLGNARFAIQDEAGLIGLNFINEPVFSRLLGFLGVKAEERAPLIAKLDDYTDIDDLVHLNGAESYHYKERNLPLPPNRFLHSPTQVRKVLDWDNYPSLWQGNIWSELTTVAPVPLPNFNTAPAMVLQATYNFDADSAQRFILARQNMPVFNLATVSQLSGMVVTVDEDAVNFFPSPYVRFSLWHSGLKQMRQVHIKFTPFADEKMPWELQYISNLPLLDAYQKVTLNDAKTPLFNSALPATTR
ncbi:MAG: type II secretion system protein GspK [Thiotrichaceae bacterium]|nr:type II secretion system protein GspK [Thiotrichaceae bacterium]